MAEAPLLGVAGGWGDAEIALARRFDQLHQLIYTRGGIRPSNAAVEEVAKLVLARRWSVRTGCSLDPAVAYGRALVDPDLVAADPSGRTHPIWPADEPFRLTEPKILAAASDLVAEIIGTGRPGVADPLGTAFDALLAGRYDHAGGLGTYLTPSGVARMMATIACDLLPPSVAVGGPFGDPFCGTGRFLVALIEELSSRPALSGVLAAGPFGADQSPSSVAKARINMLLYGVSRPLVWTVRDSVVDPDVASFTGRIPLILTNPPFGQSKYDDPEGMAQTIAAIPGLAPRNRTDPSLACLVLAVRLLAPGGVLGIVLPDGVVESPFFASLVSCADVSVAALVSLPTATFTLAGTVAKTSAVFLRRGPAPPHVALARVEHVGYLRQAGRAAPDPAGNELPLVPALVRSGLAAATSGVVSDRPLVTVVPTDSLPTYASARLDPVALDARARVAELEGIELGELLTIHRAPKARVASTPHVSVLHVDDLGTVDWHAASVYVPTSRGLLVDAGDVLVSLLNPATLRAAVMREPAQVSPEFGVFRATCDPYAVLGLLYSPLVRAQLAPLGRGTSSSRRRISEVDVLSLLVPKLSADDLADLGRSIRTAVSHVDTGRAALHTLHRTPPPLPAIMNYGS